MGKWNDFLYSVGIRSEQERDAVNKQETVDYITGEVDGLYSQIEATPNGKQSLENFKKAGQELRGFEDKLLDGKSREDREKDPNCTKSIYVSYGKPGEVKMTEVKVTEEEFKAHEKFTKAYETASIPINDYIDQRKRKEYTKQGYGNMIDGKHFRNQSIAEFDDFAQKHGAVHSDKLERFERKDEYSQNQSLSEDKSKAVAAAQSKEVQEAAANLRPHERPLEHKPELAQNNPPQASASQSASHRTV